MNAATLPMINIKHMKIGIAMMMAAGLAFLLSPREKVADIGPKVELEFMIPKQFGEWKMDEKVVVLQVNPQLEKNLEKLYSQTLSRTYMNGKGERVMLSIAYGEDQNREMQVHRPEVCYPAQGFTLLSKEKGELATSFKQVPVMRLVASQGDRIEPITYWIRFGDTLVRGNLEQGFARVSHGLRGLVADAMLVRVSTITDKPAQAYEVQDRFIKDLLTAVPPLERVQLLGKTDE